MIRLFIVASVLLGALCGAAADFDIIIRGGRIADGTGNPVFHADVGVRNGRIEAIGRLSDATAVAELDARNLIVAPGFIDVHTHAEDICEVALADNFVRMGVTTLVLGNCGGSVRDISDLFRRVTETNVSVNVATLVGHGTVRSSGMGGSFMRPPTPEELDKMKASVEQGMKDGALGISTGLIYLPGTFAKTEELIELAKVASRYEGIYVSHMRDEGQEIFKSLDEVSRIAREAGIRAHISHIKLSGKPAWGRADKVLAAIEGARAEGLDVTQDQYVYTASSTGISQLIPEAVREGGNEKFVDRLNDPAQKAAIIAEMKQKLSRNARTDYSYAVIGSYRHDPTLNGKNVVEAARLKRGSDSLDDQIEMILEIQKHGGANAVFHGMNEEDLRVYARHPHTMFASDSGMRKLGEGVPHPRGYGNNARVLARYVRELKLLRIEDAVRKMTSLPATVFRIKDRGLIREGYWADIVVFDASAVQDNATFGDPHHYATGFRHVLVNGISVIKDSDHTGARPGKPVKRAD